MDYRRDFEQLLEVVEDLSEDLLQEISIKGLKLDIQAEVHLLESRGIKAIMKIIQRAENKIQPFFPKPHEFHYLLLFCLWPLVDILARGLCAPLRLS